MGAYKCNVVVVIKMDAYIHGVLILCGCLLSQCYGMHAWKVCSLEPMKSGYKTKKNSFQAKSQHIPVT